MTKNKLFVPATTMLSGLILWLVFFFWLNAEQALSEWSFWINIIFCLLIAVLFIYSAISCRRATGGRTGNTVRAVLLIIMAAFTFLKVGIYTLIILAITAVIIGIMALKGTDFVEDSK